MLPKSLKKFSSQFVRVADQIEAIRHGFSTGGKFTPREYVKNTGVNFPTKAGEEPAYGWKEAKSVATSFRDEN